MQQIFEEREIFNSIKELLYYIQIKQTLWPSARKKIIPTYRPPQAERILRPTFVDTGLSCGQRGGTHHDR
jgi:hypothetical protein